jgi:hypothetical protein
MFFPLITSSGVELRPISADDGKKVYELLVRFGSGVLPTLETFLDGFGHGAMAQFLVHGAGEAGPVGVATLRDFNPAGHVTAELELGSAPGPGQETVALVVNYAFAMWNLRKVYLHAAEDEHDVLGLTGPLLQPLLDREALLPRHVFARGRHQDLSIYAIHRNTWEKHAANVLEALAPAQEREHEHDA